MKRRRKVMARYPSICWLCKKKVATGDMIEVLVNDHNEEGWCHPECIDEIWHD